jgi:hypothetical protein
VPQTLDQFAARAATLPGRLVEATPRAVRASGAVLETAARSNIAAVTGGDMRLSRVNGGRGSSIGWTCASTVPGRSASAHVIPSGPIMLVEENTRPHRSPKTLRQKRRRNKRVGFLYMPGIGFRSRRTTPAPAASTPCATRSSQRTPRRPEPGVLVFATATRNHLGG